MVHNITPGATLRQRSQIEALEAAKIDLLRVQHAERLARIHNERHRTIGLELDTLQQQIDEKAAIRAMDDAKEQEYQRRFLAEQKMLGAAVREDARIRRRIEQDDIKFRETYQRPEQEREWDLNRPDYVAVQPPCGILPLEGQDNGAAEREKAQEEQKRRWNLAQMALADQKREADAAEQAEWERRYLENEAAANEAAAKYLQDCDEARRRTLAENLRMAQERARARQLAALEEAAANRAEIEATNRSLFMTESRDQALGRNGKMIVQDWKGHTLKEREDMIASNRDLAQLAQEQRAREAAEEEADALKRKRDARAALARERAEKRERDAQRKQLAEDHLLAAEQHRKLENERKLAMGQQEVGYDFWTYFGKSHR